MLDIGKHKIFGINLSKTLAVYILTFVLFFAGLTVVMNENWSVPTALSIGQHIIIVMLVLFIWNVAFIRYYSIHKRFDLILGYAYLAVFILVCIQLVGFSFNLSMLVEWTDIIEHLFLGIMLLMLFPVIMSRESIIKQLKQERLLLYAAIIIVIAVLGGIAANYFKRDTHSEIIELLNFASLIILLIAFFRIRKFNKHNNEKIYKYLTISIVLLIMAEIVFAVSSSDYTSNRLYAGIFEALSFAVLAFGLLVNVIDAFKYQAKARLVLLTKNNELKLIDKQKDEFVSFVSHQLRTPLTAIKWRIDFIKNDGKLNQAQKEDVETIEKSNQKLIDLVGMFLNVSRLNMNRYIPVSETFKPFDIINIIVEENNQLIVQKNIDYIINCNKELELSYDKTALVSVLENLISNAVKYCKPNGKIQINFSLVGDYLQISVKDDGIGIPSNMQHSLFKPFVRLGNAKKSGIAGNGYGLYFIRKLVTSLGGIITFESEENIGTTFNVQLPKILTIKSEV